MCSVPVATRRTRIRAHTGDVRNHVHFACKANWPDSCGGSKSRCSTYPKYTPGLRLASRAGCRPSKRARKREINPFPAIAPHFARTRALLPDLSQVFGPIPRSREAPAGAAGCPKMSRRNPLYVRTGPAGPAAGPPAEAGRSPGGGRRATIITALAGILRSQIAEHTEMWVCVCVRYIYILYIPVSLYISSGLQALYVGYTGTRS